MKESNDMKNIDLLIIGAGPAGLSAAISAADNGIEKVLIVDRLSSPGGMLTQCFHHGFGLGIYEEQLSGPEFISRLISSHPLDILTNSFVSNIEPDFTVNIINENALYRLKPQAIIVATGCRERPIGALEIYGSRPSGVFTAGSVQKMINLFNYSFGKRAVILGSGDVGLIVSHHLSENGTEVVAVIEKLDHISGLERNKTLYIDQHNIPIRTNETITALHGKKRLEAITVCSVDNDGVLIPGTEYEIACDTLITSVGLIPELEIINSLGLDFNGDYLLMDEPPSTFLPNLFVCGNANTIHSLVDSVVDEGTIAGQLAAEYIKSK